MAQQVISLVDDTRGQDEQVLAYLAPGYGNLAAGCPMGRGDTVRAAVADLERRINTCQELQLKVNAVEFMSVKDLEIL